MVTSHLYTFSGEMSLQILCPFFLIEIFVFVLLSCMSSSGIVFVYSRRKSVVSCVIRKIYLPFCALSFHSLDGVFSSDHF